MRSFVVLLVAALFITMMVSGLMAFFLPFDGMVTRVHATVAPLFALFVGWHIIHNRKSFGRYLSPKHWVQIGATVAVLVGVGWLLYLNAPPVRAWMNQSYEKRRVDIVFRPSQQVSMRRVEKTISIKRADEQVALEIDVELNDRFADEGDFLAIWLETDQGKMLETLHLSESLMFEDTIQPGDQGSVTRKGLLPVWWHRWRAHRAEVSASQATPQGVDAVTQPTPRMDFQFATLVNMQQPRFVVMVEVSQPNQPSQIYNALVDLDGLKKYYLLDFLARGTTEGRLGYDLAGFSIEDLAVEKAIIGIGDKRSASP